MDTELWFQHPSSKKPYRKFTLETKALSVFEPESLHQSGGQESAIKLLRQSNSTQSVQEPHPSERTVDGIITCGKSLEQIYLSSRENTTYWLLLLEISRSYSAENFSIGD